MPDSLEIERKLRETEPAKVRGMKTAEIIELERFFAEKLPAISASGIYQHYRGPWQSRMDFLGSVIADRALAKQTECQHKASYKIEKWILGLAVASVVIGILALVAEYVPLIRGIFSPKAQPASALRSTPSSLRQTPTPTAAAK